MKSLFNPNSLSAFAALSLCLAGAGCFQSSTTSQSKGSPYDLTGQITQVGTSKLNSVLVSGRTFYVSKSSGSDNLNDCSNAQSSTTPKATITAGLGCMAGGDTLVIKDGTYDERIVNSIPSGSAGYPTTIRAEHQNKVIIRPNDNTLNDSLWGVILLGGGVSVANSYITIDGIVADGQDTYGPNYQFGNNDASSVEIHHIILQNGKAINSRGPQFQGNGGIVIGSHINNNHHDIQILHMECAYSQNFGIYVSGAHDVLIEGNICHDNDTIAFQSSDSGGVGNARITVRNNIFYNNNAVTAGGDPYSVYFNIVSDNQFYNNLMYNNNGGISIGYSGSDNTQIYNNTIYGNNLNHSNTPGIAIESNARNTFIKNNIIYGNFDDTIYDAGTATTKSNNLIAINPYFVDAASGNFHLKSTQSGYSVTSPAINAGANVGVTTDLDGNQRDSQPDIGAYEYADSDSSSTDCRMTVPSCPNHPETSTAEFSDDYEGAASNQPRCMQRAQDYYDWCGTSDPVTAKYLSSGVVVQQTTYSTVSQPDTTAPTVAITAPANGATVTARSKTQITANASDNVAAAKVEFYVGNTLTCTDTEAPYTCAWNVPALRGRTFTLKAIAYDTASPANTKTSANVTVTSN